MLEIEGARTASPAERDWQSAPSKNPQPTFGAYALSFHRAARERSSIRQTAAAGSFGIDRESDRALEREHEQSGDETGRDPSTHSRLRIPSYVCNTIHLESNSLCPRASALEQRRN